MHLNQSNNQGNNTDRYFYLLKFACLFVDLLCFVDLLRFGDIISDVNNNIKNCMNTGDNNISRNNESQQQNINWQLNATTEKTTKK